MGNKFNTENLNNFISEISETIDINENFLKQEFYSFYENVSIDSTKNIHFITSFQENFNKLEEYQIFNFIKNLLAFMKCEYNDYKEQESQQGLQGQGLQNNYLKPSAEILSLIVDNIYLKFKTLRELFLKSSNYFYLIMNSLCGNRTKITSRKYWYRQ